MARVMFLQTLKRDVAVSGKNIPEGEHSRCKGPEAEVAWHGGGAEGSRGGEAVEGLPGVLSSLRSPLSIQASPCPPPEARLEDTSWR